MRQLEKVPVQEQKYRNFPTLIVQIVLVIVTAVQVNTQQLCPSGCQCYTYSAICANLFSDVTEHSTKIPLCIKGTTSHWNFKTGVGSRYILALVNHATDNSRSVTKQCNEDISDSFS